MFKATQLAFHPSPFTRARALATAVVEPTAIDALAGAIRSAKKLNVYFGFAAYLSVSVSVNGPAFLVPLYHRAFLTH